MIATSTFIALGLELAFGIIVPVAVAIWWLKTKHEKFVSVLVGAFAFLVFALVLEGAINFVVLNVLPTGKVLSGSAVLYTVYGCLMAGLFEETGRFVAFKTLLRKRTNKETGISYGIGHGGFEAMIALGYAAFQLITYAVLINNGQFQNILDQVAATGADISPYEAIPDMIKSVTIGAALLAMCERVFAMLLHIALSILVFYSVRKSKITLYLLAILLHALFDVPAALYQTGKLNMVTVEISLAILAVLMFAVIYNVLYKKDKAHAPAAPAAGPQAGTESNTAAEPMEN